MIEILGFTILFLVIVVMGYFLRHAVMFIYELFKAGHTLLKPKHEEEDKEIR